MSSFSPLVAIVGSTGVSKTRLAIELALKLSGECHVNGWHGAKVINGDAMQCYKGLDILTNKATREERKGVEHLLMDFRAPGQQYFVTDWVRDATSVIDGIHRQKEVPIVVGGTAYYIQNLILGNRLASTARDTHEQSSETVTNTADLQAAIDQLPPELYALWQSLPQSTPSTDQVSAKAISLHNLLTALDPENASRWHWRDSRRVLTSLRVIQQQGMKVSDFNALQEADVHARYHTLVFWLYSDPSTLHPKLDSRVEAMIKAGMLSEVESLRKSIKPSSAAAGDELLDFSTGIFQSIGKRYRELDQHLRDLETGIDPPMSLAKATERIKNSTRQYAKRQIQWLRNKFVPLLDASGKVRWYILQHNDPADWEPNVWSKAVGLLEGDFTPRLHRDRPTDHSEVDFLNEMQLPLREEVPFIHAMEGPKRSASEQHKKRVCPICTHDFTHPVLIEEGPEWSAHTRSRRHRKALRKLKSLNSGASEFPQTAIQIDRKDPKEQGI